MVTASDRAAVSFSLSTGNVGDGPEGRKPVNFTAANAELQQDYLLHRLLAVETQGSASLLNIQAFADPFNYQFLVKKPGSEESAFGAVRPH